MLNWRSRYSRALKQTCCAFDVHFPFDVSLWYRENQQNLRGWVSSINSKMIRTMSASLTNDNALLPTLARATKDFKPARAVVMLVLLDSLLSNSSGIFPSLQLDNLSVHIEHRLFLYPRNVLMELFVWDAEVHISASDYFTLLSREWDSVQSDENFASPHLSMVTSCMQDSPTKIMCAGKTRQYTLSD